MTTNILRTIESSKQRMMQYRSEQQHAQFIADFSLRYFQATHSLAIVESCLQAMFSVANANNEELEDAFSYLIEDKLRAQVYDLLAIACKSLNANYSNAIQAIAQFDSADNILSFYEELHHASEEERKAIAYAVDFVKTHANDTAIVSVEALERAKTHDCDNVAAIYYSLHDDYKHATSMMQQQQYANAIDKFAIINMQACQAFEILESNLQAMLSIANVDDENAIETLYDTFCHLQEVAYTAYTSDYFDDIADDENSTFEVLRQKALKLFNSAKFAIASLNNENCKYAFDYTLLSNMTHCDCSFARERLQQMQLSDQERNDYMKAIKRFQQHAQRVTLTSVEALELEQRSK